MVISMGVSDVLTRTRRILKGPAAATQGKRWKQIRDDIHVAVQEDTITGEDWGR